VGSTGKEVCSGRRGYWNIDKGYGAAEQRLEPGFMYINLRGKESRGGVEKAAKNLHAPKGEASPAEYGTGEGPVRDTSDGPVEK